MTMMATRAGAGQLERHGGRLRAAARHPGVVDHQHVSAGHGPFDPQPARVDAAPVRRPGRGNRQAGQRESMHARIEGGQRMTARRGRGRSAPPRPRPGRPLGRDRSAPPRRRPGRPSSPPRATPTPCDLQIGGQPPAAAGPADSSAPAPSDLYRHRSSASRPPLTAYPIGATASASSPPGLAARQVALIAPGKPDRRRPPAGPLADHLSMLRTSHRQNPSADHRHAATGSGCTRPRTPPSTVTRHPPPSRPT